VARNARWTSREGEPGDPGLRPRRRAIHSDPDATVVEACQSTERTGLEGPFRELYDLYKDRVYNVCYRITGNATDALDASQETFGIVFRKLSEFRLESKVSGWGYRNPVDAGLDLQRRLLVLVAQRLESATDHGMRALRRQKIEVVGNPGQTTQKRDHGQENGGQKVGRNLIG